MNFDWTKPVVIDWSGRRGPLISEDDIKNSVIKRILHNQFYPPFCEKEYIPVKPWWNPQDPFGCQIKYNNRKHILFIPGLRPLPAYPQLSTLTKQQHLQGLKVMSTRFDFVQPRDYPQPTQKDVANVEEFQALYEAEQKEYLKWSKLLWLNGDCLRVLRPKPTIERVYDAEFRLRAHEMLSMPQQYSLAAQIPLQKEEQCEMELKEDLINVDIQDLPTVDYPEEMESEFSVLMKTCLVPEPCKEHPCKFVLPHEETVTVLPLAEVHRELAQYAASNGSSFVASENALRCLLDTDRSWKISVSVVEVVCPEYGDLKTIVVLGSEFNAQKECSTQRTYKAYKHLLRHTFTPSIGQYKSKSPTKQSTSQKLTSSPPANKDLHDDLEVSSDEDASEKLLIADGERKKEPKKLLDLCEHTIEPDRINRNIEKPMDQFMTEPNNSHECSRETDPLIVDNPNNSNPVPSYGLDFYEPGYNKDNTISYSHNEPFRLMDNASKPESRCGLDFYQPDYSINTRPDYSRDNDDPSSEPDKLMIDPIIINPESIKGYEASSRNESNETMINDQSNSEIDDDSSPAIETHDETAPILRNDASLSEVSEETFQMLQASDILGRNSTTVLEINPTLNFETNTALDVNTDNIATSNTYLVDKHNKSISSIKCEDNESTLSSKQCESQIAEVPKTPSPIKPCRITVRNLSISELKPYNIEALFNSPNTEVPEKIHSVTQMNDDVSIFNESHEKTIEGPARLGISGIISRNRSSRAIQNTENNPLVEKTDEDLKLGVSENSTNKRSLKKSDSNSIEISNTDNTKDDNTNIETGITRKRSISGTCKNSKVVPETPKENPKSSEISKMITRNRSLNRTHNFNEDVIEKSKEVSPKLEISRTTNRNQMAKGNPMMEKVKERSLGIGGMITRNRSLSGTDKLLEKSKVTPKLKISKIKNRHQKSGVSKSGNIEQTNEDLRLGISGMMTRNRSLSGTEDVVEKCTPKHVLSKMKSRNQNSRGTCKSRNTDGPITEKANEVSRVEISGMMTRNRSLSETEDVNKSKEVTPKLEMSKTKSSNQNFRGTCKSKNIDDPITEKANEVSRVEISGMMTRNRSLSGTEDVDKSKEVTPKLEMSELKSKNQNSRETCKSRNIDDPITDKANEVSRLEISGIVTRSRSLSGTDNSNESIEHTEKSKEINLKKRSGDFNKNLTSPKKQSKKAVSVTPVRNVYTRTSQYLELHGCDKDNVNENTFRKSIELSPVKPCSVYVEPIQVEPFASNLRKSIEISPAKPCVVSVEQIDKSALKTLTNNFETIVDNKGKEPTNIVDTLQSADINRKRSIIESNTDIPNVIEPYNRYANLKTYLQKSKKKYAAKKKSPIKKNTNYFINSFINTGSNLDDSTQPSTKRIRKLSEHIILEHDYCPIGKNSEKARKRSISEIEHDYCASDPSCNEESDKNELFVDCVPAIDNYIKHLNTIEKTFDASIFNKKTLGNVEGNITSSETSSNTKTISRKISLSKLFGDDSDSDEPIALKNNDMKAGRNQIYNIKKLSFSDPIDTEQSPLKSCLKKNTNDFPKNKKRKLSFSDPEFNTCGSESDSEDAIAGFLNGIAVPCKTLSKNFKKQTTHNRTCGLRSRKKTRTENKSNITEQNKEIGRFTKIMPDKQTNAKNIQRRSSCSNSESDDFVSRSRHNLLASKQNINTNKQKIQNTSLRRSRRLSTRTNAENNQLRSKSPTTKTNDKESPQITKGRRFSVRLSTKENVQPNTKCTKNGLSNSLSNNTSKITKKDRRKSLPSNIFSQTTRNNLILRSKSLTNLNENADKRTKYLSLSNFCTLPKSPNQNRSDSLKLSERTKRYLRRVFNFDCTESDQSGDEISQRTERYIHSSRPLSSDTELSDTENKKTRRYTRSSMSLNSKATKTRSRNKADYIEKTKRYTRRSAAAYSSCDETVQAPVKRTKTKRHGIVNTDCSTITANTSAESNAEQFSTDEIKTEPETKMDTIETIEKYQIQIDVIEETESVDNETLPVLHHIELPRNLFKRNTSQANVMTNERINMSYNETDIEFDGRRICSTDSLIVTNESINNNQKDSKVIDTKYIDASPKTLKNNLGDVDSDDSDFFNMCVNDEFNILHFTATNESDSEEDTLTIDDCQSNLNVTETVKKNKPKDIQPKTPQTVKCNLFSECQQTTQADTGIVENIKTQSVALTPTKISNDEFAGSSSEDLSRHNKPSENKCLPKDVNDVIGAFNCTCKGTPFEVPSPRSFKKWSVRNKNSQINFNVIVHSSHRARKGTSEVLLEPIVEYQPELGGSRQPRGRLRAAALGLLLRQDAALINVRIDHDNGNVIVIDHVTNDEFIRRHGDKRSEVADTMYTALDQLRFLMPGHYVLAHEPSHGTNAMLYTTKGAHDRGATVLNLHQTNTNMPDAEDALYAKIPPELDLAVLPYHKHRSILPLAFTPHKLGIREEQKMAAALARARPPPSAIQWPKKKKKSKKRPARQNANRQPLTD